MNISKRLDHLESLLNEGFTRLQGYIDRLWEIEFGCKPPKTPLDTNLNRLLELWRRTADMRLSLDRIEKEIEEQIREELNEMKESVECHPSTHFHPYRLQGEDE